MRNTVRWLRGLLLILGLVLGAGLVVIGIIAYTSRRDLPEYAHLAWPTYIGILLGFVPVALVFARLYALAAVGADAAVDVPRVLRAVGDIRRYIGWFCWWFAAGLVVFRLAFGFVGPPIGVLWLLLECTALLLLAVVTVFERLLRAVVQQSAAADRPMD